MGTDNFCNNKCWILCSAQMPACFLEQIQDFKKGVVLRVQIQAAKAVPCRGRGGGGLWESCPGKFLKLRCLKMTFPAYWGQTCQFVVMSHFLKKNLGFTQTPEPSRFVKPPMSKNQNCQAWVVAYRSWSLARAYIIIGLKLCLISIIMVTAETHPLTEMFYSM